MPDVSVKFYRREGRPDSTTEYSGRHKEQGALFEGSVDPDGAEGYVFSGTLSVTCQITDDLVTNTVALGHGGASSSFSYERREIDGTEENTFQVSGRGKREKNEDVDLRVGINLYPNGTYQYGDKVTAIVGGPPQPLKASYSGGGSGVSFEGHAWADGPDGYAIKGKLSAWNDKTNTTQEYATLGYGSESESWHYKTVAIGDKQTNEDILVRGSRDSDEGVVIILGATTGTANTYDYGDKVTCAPLPLKF
ncbi:hypothetical protein [Streptomyces lushanensis]|uniref:hypothetical protein n=1 Tax=Streptomyces lushanensis TaxID=1434255 RepID=UPI0008325F8A|nr:hypothetical protein [Streptomyces lushanensis]